MRFLENSELFVFPVIKLLCLELGMPTKIKFKKSVLAHCMHSMFNTSDLNKLLCTSVFLSVFVAPAVFAADELSDTPQNILTNASSTFATIEPENSVENGEVKNTVEQLETAAKQQGLPNNKIEQIDEKLDELQQKEQTIDSLKMLQEQEQNANNDNNFKPIEFTDLEDLPATSFDQSMTNEIFQAAETAKTEAENFRSGMSQSSETSVSNVTEQELTEITQAPINVDELMRSIQADSQIAVEANEAGKTLSQSALEGQKAEVKEPNFFKRLLYRIRPPKFDSATVDKISAEVDGAPTLLASNIKAKLSTFTVEAFSDFNGAVPQLRSLANQAAQAVGYYNAQFKFQKENETKVKVVVTPNDPVKVKEQEIEFSGAGANLPQFQVIRVLPEQEEGDIFNHGKYEATKARINDASANNGFFDSYWRLHDVKVAQPQNEADINLRYETGERYKLGEVEFKMSDPSQPLPIDLEILKSMAPWKEGADYTAWRINGLANNLTNSRYFNYTLVDTVKPDPIQKPLELPPDLQTLVDQQNISESIFNNQTEVNATAKSSKEVTQNVVDEKQFAGTSSQETDPNLRKIQVQQEQKQSEEDRLKDQVRNDKVIPVVVTLNADRLNSVETGIGYGTDTGVRLRGQYRRAIVNHLGHSFDANMELSQIRQSFDARYNIPYKHPLNDYISIVGGYEREDRDNVGNGSNLIIESAVLGADRIIKASRNEWQHVFGFRYRLDSISLEGTSMADFDPEDIPDAFLVSGASDEQQSLLFGYEISKTSADNRLNPTMGFKQSYKLQLGSESLLTDANMAIVNADWKALYSVGENDDHQFIAGANLGYIYSDDFEKVPYNLRFFAGGDQSLRGFDYKSLSPVEAGYKIGGQALAVGSLEYNYQFKEGWRAAIFTDFGNAYDKKFSNDSEYSLGLGIRWKSPIGPIRLDVASGISDPGHPIRLHFFIGSQL